MSEQPVYESDVKAIQQFQQAYDLNRSALRREVGFAIIGAVAGIAFFTLLRTHERPSLALTLMCVSASMFVCAAISAGVRAAALQLMHVIIDNFSPGAAAIIREKLSR